MIDALATSVSLVASWQVLAVLLGGLLIGWVFGAIPGLNNAIAMSVLLPLTFYLPPIVAILFLTAIYTGGICGGGISAILIGVPGQASNVATVADGFAMTRAGRHPLALGLSIYSSAAGVTISYLLLLALLFPATQVVRNFGPADRISIAFAALVVVASVLTSDLLRGFAAVAFGLMLGTLGPTEGGTLRSSFLGIPDLYDGLPLLPVVTGLVGFSELLANLRQEFIVQSPEGRRGVGALEILGAWREWLSHWPVVIYSSLVGFVIGFVPAAGAAIAALAAYGQVKMASRRPDAFGKGEPRGVTASESASHASEGGAMLSMLALGIPGSASAAILMGAFTIFGLQPGPVWITNNLPFASAVVLGNVAIALLYIPLGALFVVRLARIVTVPLRYLSPTLIVIGSAGVYAVRTSVVDVALLWGFAYLGLMLTRLGYPTIGVLLGVILAPSIDSEMQRVIALYGHDIFGTLSRPVVFMSIAISVVAVAAQLLGLYRRSEGPRVNHAV